MNPVINSVAIILLTIFFGSVFIAAVVIFIWSAIEELIKGQ